MSDQQFEKKTQQEFDKLLSDLNQTVSNGQQAEPEVKAKIIGYAKLLQDQNSSQEFKEFIMSKLFEIKANEAMFNALNLTPEEDETVKQIILSQIN